MKIVLTASEKEKNVEEEKANGSSLMLISLFALSFSFSRDAETKENGVDESQHGTKEKNLQAGAMRRGKKVARLLFVFLVDG